MNEKEVNYLINQLLNYALRTRLIEELDIIYCANCLIELFQLTSYKALKTEDGDIYSVLDQLSDYAYKNKIITSNDVTTYDLFQTKIMGMLLPKPSIISKEFFKLFSLNKIEATQYFYNLAVSSNYIRMNRITRNIHFKYPCEYGILDITINLSKPEKDPKMIALEKSLPSYGYPKCAICYENVGFCGNIKQDARQNLRVIPLTLDNENYFLQYSPYSYFNEHAIIFNQKHIPMKVDKKTFSKLLDFVSQFDHYFVGSNADLPIVGGSILSHDHFQGGRYTFPMFMSNKIKVYSLKDYENVKLEYLNWPVDTLCLKGKDKESILDLADKILQGWISYHNEAIKIISHTQEVRHNTITPIARKIEEEFQLYLSLRNNKTTPDFPEGIFHPNSMLHHIKKENIGLIEVMGLAVLPKRLQAELDSLKDVFLQKASKEMLNEEPLRKHKDWSLLLMNKYKFTEENIQFILENEVGEIFKKVLEDCGVFKFGHRLSEMDKFIYSLFQKG
ncbi:MAG: UDP-glucose--hexose-1-phosphate uridylyltransferase [Anaeroplasmataceae bacterium]|nr:UDP-glucose--hexose-1-phosphate uridylyltransferase [Anaeroplasmataceae bacterium]